MGLEKKVSMHGNEEEANCLICLSSVANQNTVKCPNNHALHVQCALKMMARMGRHTCPYCFQQLGVIPLVHVKPSVWSRVMVSVEHGVYVVVMFILLLCSAHSYPILWKLNWSITKLRWRYEHFEVHVEGLMLIRAWMLRKIVCIAVGLAIAVCESVLRHQFGYVYEYASAFAYGFVIVMYGDTHEGL